MPQTKTAAEHDTLCGIAVGAGFLNCDPLRAEPANAAFLNRPLQKGDIVTIPDKKTNVSTKIAEKMHVFERKGVPPPGIRFVHGSPDKPYRDDPDLDHLNVSNFISNKGGTNGQKDFPSTFGFNAFGHADPDVFKIEVVDPNASSDVIVDLEALKPLYAADGTVSGHASFSDSQAGLRKIKVKCQKVSNPNYKGFRSRYLRLVTDEEDMKALSGAPPRTDGSAQGLFTSDMADGNNGDADKVEILDQLVRATYVISGCKAPDPNKCKAQAQLEIGPRRMRIKVCFHLFRTTVGGTAVGGITEQKLRRRTGKWYRRAYAQAELAPKLVAPVVELVDPPAFNMLVLSNDTGTPVSGANSILSFDLDLAPAGGSPPPVQTVSVNLVAGQTPALVAAAVVAALPAGFSGQAFTNAPAFTAVNGSADVIITRTDGKRVVIRNETCTDAGLTVDVARVALSAVDQGTDNTPLIPASLEFRRVIRAAPGTGDRMECYIIGQFLDTNLRGRAFVPAIDLPANFQPQAPLLWATVMASNSSDGTVMDGSDNLPFTYPHESGHVLIDAFHTSGWSSAGTKVPFTPGGLEELMSTGTSPTNAVDATKRICDSVQIKYAMFQTQPAATAGASVATAISAVDRLRARGATVFDAW